MASVPAIYAGLFLLKIIKPIKKSTLYKVLAGSIGIGILFASFYDLAKGTLYKVCNTVYKESDDTINIQEILILLTVISVIE